jgi:hypothetical protein
MSRRSEVYSWRVSPALKTSLEESARRERRPVSRLLEEIVQGYLARRSEPGHDVAVQQRLHARVARFAGCIAGNQRRRAENARALVRSRLRRWRRAG